MVIINCILSALLRKIIGAFFLIIDTLQIGNQILIEVIVKVTAVDFL